jgi:hypothetical protein
MKYNKLISILFMCDAFLTGMLPRHPIVTVFFFFFP